MVSADLAKDLMAIVGFVLLSCGAGCVYWPAGVITAGVLLLAASVHMDRNLNRKG